MRHGDAKHLDGGHVANVWYLWRQTFRLFAFTVYSCHNLKAVCDRCTRQKAVHATGWILQHSQNGMRIATCTYFVGWLLNSQICSVYPKQLSNYWCISVTLNL